MENGIKKGDIVAIIMEKGWEQIVAVYGTLFAGATYLPIDIHNPKERIEKILNDSEAKKYLIQPKVLNVHKWLDRKECVVVSGEKDENEFQPVQNTLEDIAYVIYTSGSTGMPKGL